MNQIDYSPPWLPVRRQNRLDREVYQQPGTFFVTIGTHNRDRWFAHQEVARHCMDELKASSREHSFALIAYCFMPDHVHLLVSSEGDADLIRFVRDFKQRTGWWFRNRSHAGGLKASPTSTTDRPSLWQRSFYDHILRDEEDLEKVTWYILENPVHAGLAASFDEYPYTWSAASEAELARA